MDKFIKVQIYTLSHPKYATKFFEEEIDKLKNYFQNLDSNMNNSSFFNDFKYDTNLPMEAIPEYIK